MSKLNVLIGLTLLVATAPAGAHGGGLDADGCHNNRKTGDHHCHRSPAPAHAAPVRSTAAAPRPSQFAGEQRRSSASTDRAFSNCTEAREAGAAPVRRGEPGYGPHLDRYDDGIGCE